MSLHSIALETVCIIYIVLESVSVAHWVKLKQCSGHCYVPCRKICHRYNGIELPILKIMIHFSVLLILTDRDFSPPATTRLFLSISFLHFRRSYEKKTKDIAGECNLFHHKTLSQLDAILICPCADDDGVCWVGNIIKVEQMLTWNETKKVKRKQLEFWNIFSEFKSKAQKNVSVFVQLRN